MNASTIPRSGGHHHPLSDPSDDHRPLRRHSQGQADLIAGLWQEAPFARLPDDAPDEMHCLVQDVENPRRVYAIHRASRRHDFQLLVDRFVFQLRNGCGSSRCSTPTCFTCRKRLAGKAPLRRYNPTSARTLAVYLASQDEPERGLCPYLNLPREPSAAVNTLIFSARFPLPSSTARKNAAHSASPSKSSTRKAKPSPDSPRSPSSSRPRASPTVSATAGPDAGDMSSRNQATSKASSPTPSAKVSVHERPVSKDHRSFAATTFGTVAFKMLEWLTPQGVDYISKELSAISRMEPGQVDDPPEAAPGSEPPSVPKNNCRQSVSNSSPKIARQESHSSPISEAQTAPPSDEAPKPKRGTKASSRTQTSSFSKARGPIEPLAIPTTATEEAKPTPKGGSINSFHSEKLPRSGRMAPTVITRGVPEIPLKPAFFENVPCISPPVLEEVNDVDLGSSDQAESDEDNATNLIPSPTNRSRPSTPIKRGAVDLTLADDAPWIHCPLPQSLRLLNLELVDFICDLFQEDHTREQLFPGPPKTSEVHPIPQNRTKKLCRRRPRPGHGVSKWQWKAFNEQTFFHVLSDPHSLLASFTRDGKLYDSQTLWYCMLRMTRAAPSLVLHSLWLAAGSLFVPPKSLQRMRSPAGKLFSQDAASLSAFESGCLMSICLHALVAAVPYVADAATLHDMSRLRSRGLVLAGSGPAARQPSWICLDYEDVFSNELALRLARRLFCAITARRCFAEIANCDMTVPDGPSTDDVLRQLLDQLDLLCTDPCRLLEFSHPERLLHETRVPTLLLDWARAVLLKEWDGRPEFSTDGPFYGALSLMATLYEKRSMLHLGDSQFRVEYFSDRLDAMELPVAWAAFTPTRQRRHLLDYPYLFSPETLVSFFRSINFSRMSRAFEESSSLKTRMSAIVDPGSLVTNPHHKRVLQDMLKTASSKYFVLDIERKSVVDDAFDQLWRRQERELLRPLKIHLGESNGEEGFDSGGVQQEFFRLAMAECLDPKYGAFAVDERTRMAWFMPGSLVEEWRFEMIGLLASLAVYNGLTLPVTFPRALYRKLLGQPVEQLHHISDGWPELASGLTSLLEWDEREGLVEDVFARTYHFSVPSFGGDVTLAMSRDNDRPWPQARDWFAAKTARTATATTTSRGGAAAETKDDERWVTSANRDEYVTDYIRYLTDVSIRPQFQAFERGFRTCLDAKSLSLLTPPLLQSVVEGVQEIDLSELRRHARYVGWDSSHHTVKDFWSIVKKYDERMKRKLLEFVTASDRVPVGGIKNLQFVVQKNGGEEGEGGHLPTAYTCYGTLLLPVYRDKEVLRQRLGMALENAQGFGFA